MQAQWDIFCRVVDNFGDIGVCWRLAAELAARKQTVRLFTDDASALRWMAPDGAAGVAVERWPAGADGHGVRARADVVVEAFGCDPPARFVERMAAAPQPPVWINLEYLSAESVVARNHGLPSPQHTGPGRGLVKWFYYPGFTPDTGGLIREADLVPRQRRFDRRAWLRRFRVPDEPHERLVTLFCYDNPALPALIDRLADTPTRLLVPPGPAAPAVRALLGDTLRHGTLSATLLPHLSQIDFDHLLWCADINFVRGEDSFVRAQFAGAPFVWQAYPQADGAHAGKLDAFLRRALESAPSPLAAAVRALHHAWNGLAPMPDKLPPKAAWMALATRWRAALLTQSDLVERLLAFAHLHHESQKR